MKINFQNKCLLCYNSRKSKEDIIMTTLQINSNDKNSIQQLLDIAKNKLHLDVFILRNDSDTAEKSKTQTKWGEFAQKMDGLFTPEIIEHINTSRKEARDKFIVDI